MPRASTPSLLDLLASIDAKLDKVLAAQTADRKRALLVHARNDLLFAQLEISPASRGRRTNYPRQLTDAAKGAADAGHGGPSTGQGNAAR